MFDKTVLVMGGRGSTTHNHTHIDMVDPSIEKGARFLDEVQEKAEQRIGSMAVLNIPSIDASLVHYDRNLSHMDMSIQHYLAFKINGREFNLRLSQEEARDHHAMIEKFVKTLEHELLKQINPGAFLPR